MFEKKRFSHEKSSSIDGKSSKSSSKEKIKVTAKMIDEINCLGAKKGKNSKALVHLGGGKSPFKKFLSDLKAAIRGYLIWHGSREEEVRFEGSRRNGMRWGKGKLYYRNGSMYEGDFRENARHGQGILSLNGVILYEGEWHLDLIQGEGYIKSMRFMSNECPSSLLDATYCGHFLEGRLHGMGTLFLNQREKIVTKFEKGSPLGDLTYYSLQEIEFGVWPLND